MTASVESPTIDAMSTPTDPMMMFRDMVAQWEKMANEYGGQFLARPETAELMHKATAANLQVQSAMQGAMEKMLGAANMPTKTQVEALGERLSAVEATLARIEAKLNVGSGSPSDAPRPTRARTPAQPA